MRQTAVIILILVGIAVWLLLWEFVLPTLTLANGRLSINTNGVVSKVFIDSKEVGTTPFYSDHLRLGDHKIELRPETENNFTFTTQTTLNSSTLSVIDLDLGKSSLFSAGENFYFKEGLASLSLISHPEGATVTIDGENKGNSPANQSLEAGVHTIRVEKNGYLTREIPLTIKAGYKLSVLVYLAASPFESLKKIDHSTKTSFFVVSNNFVDLSRSFKIWADGVFSLQDSLDNTATKFDYLIDANGKVYVGNKTEWDNKKSTKSLVNVGYLTRKITDQVNETAQKSWEEIKKDFN